MERKVVKKVFGKSRRIVPCKCRSLGQLPNFHVGASLIWIQYWKLLITKSQKFLMTSVTTQMALASSDETMDIIHNMNRLKSSPCYLPLYFYILILNLPLNEIFFRLLEVHLVVYTTPDEKYFSHYLPPSSKSGFAVMK